eukprot:TRINITY_DN214_c1_g1_i1.p1 TRINITY_DN214_c1_g1~~TRINITY_DN214_c1_g1_i1.p1  ORF type:complete len:286 (+),score=71.39 TRINITY_DN214_c1_g1_i1:126-860(+)
MTLGAAAYGGGGGVYGGGAGYGMMPPQHYHQQMLPHQHQHQHPHPSQHPHPHQHHQPHYGQMPSHGGGGGGGPDQRYGGAPPGYGAPMRAHGYGATDEEVREAAAKHDRALLEAHASSTSSSSSGDLLEVGAGGRKQRRKDADLLGTVGKNAISLLASLPPNSPVRRELLHYLMKELTTPECVRVFDINPRTVHRARAAVDNPILHIRYRPNVVRRRRRHTQDTGATADNIELVSPMTKKDKQQ